MSYQVIADFRGGLDRRKFVLSLPPGTLTQLVNAHITQGGEIEKRKAFGTLQLPNQTFGAQETDSGIVVFGSRSMGGVAGYTTIPAVVNAGVTYTEIFFNLAAGQNLPIAGDPITVSGSGNAGVNGTWVVSFVAGAGPYAVSFVTGAVGSIVSEATQITPYFAPPAIYQQVTHPLPNVNMTAVTASTYFDGQALAVTTWDNGDTLLFDGSAILKDFYVGKQGSIETTAYAIANDICDQLTATGSYTTVKPTLSPLVIQITGGSNGGGNTVGTINYNFGRFLTLSTGGGGAGATSFTICNIATPFNTSNNQTAADVVAAINNTANGNVYGFVATAGSMATGVFVAGAGNAVQIVVPATDFYGASIAINALDSVSVVPTGNVVIYNPPPSATFDVFSIPSTSSPLPFVVSAVASGATLSYQLVSNGVKAAAGVGAIGQFTLFNGGSNAAASTILTISANVQNGDTVTIGSTVYTFVTTITTAANNVLVDVSTTASLSNLIAAINRTSGAGTTYSASTSVNTQVSASALSGSTTTITANVGGSAANSVATTTTSAGLAFTGATLAGGGAAAVGYVTSNNTNVSNNDTVTIAGKVYTFQTVLTNTDGHVFIGADANTSLLNLLLAVNLTGTGGTQYAAATTKNTSVTAYNQDTANHRIYFQAIVTGSGGNAITLAKSAATLTLSAATLAGGGTDVNQITQITVGAQTLLSNYVPFNASVAQTAADVVTAINAYSGTSKFTATAAAGVITLFSQTAGTTYNQANVTVLSAGNVISANCFFIIAPTVANGTVSSIVVGTGSNILTASIVYQDTGHAAETVGAYVQRIVNNINAYSGTSGILAYADVANSAIYLGAASNSSADITASVTVTATAVVSGTSIILMTATANPTLISGAIVGYNQSHGVYESFRLGQTALASITVVGGLFPYYYTWTFSASISTATGGQAVLTNGAGPATINSNGMYSTGTSGTPPGSVIGILTCVVTDSTPNTPQSVTLQIQVFWS